MSADSDHPMGEPAPDQPARDLDWETADFAAPEEPGWYADDALAIDEPAWETPDLNDPPDEGAPQGARSLMAAGLMPSRLTRSWPRWSISSSAMGWTSWMMTS